MGHSGSLLEWPLVLQPTQKRCDASWHSLVLWLCLHVAQVSCVAVQVFAVWPYPWHFTHRMGSRFSFHGWSFVFPMRKPSLTRVLAAEEQLRVNTMCVTHWFSDRSSIGLAHLIPSIDPVGILLSFSISSIQSLLVMSCLMGRKGTRMGYCLSLIIPWMFRYVMS